jgi:hypothetical protein
LEQYDLKKFYNSSIRLVENFTLGTAAVPILASAIGMICIDQVNRVAYDGRKSNKRINSCP